MQSPAVTIMGAGVAGLSAALLLARDGRQVTLVERDTFEEGPPENAPGWQRKGIPHFLQPHAFIPRGRAELKEHFTDVYDALLAAGAYDVDVRVKMPGPAGPGDEDLQYLAVRRPLLEWALRRAVRAEPLIDLRQGVRVDGLCVEDRRVTGVRVDGGNTGAGVLVDALGRRTPTADWMGAAGVVSDPVQSNDCGVVYYSRYYRLRPGFELPDGPWILSPRGDLGYLGYATFPGDNRTFAAVLSVPTGVSEWRVLKDADVFEAVVAQVPGLRLWVNPAGVDPITDVLPMAGLRNTIRTLDVTSAGGTFPVGDAFSHTDPALAHGLSFALIHAVELTAALRAHCDPTVALAAYAAATTPAIRERYELATALDEQRHRMWLGEPVDFTRHDGDYALFTLVAGGAGASIDAAVFRMFVRRIGLLDSTAVLDTDTALQIHIEDLFRQMVTSPRPPAGPPREEMLAAAAAAMPA